MNPINRSNSTRIKIAEISRRENKSKIRSETTVPSEVYIFILLVLEIK